jgi:hypothetical protein
MAQQTINVGTSPNDGTGTPLRTAFQYTNSNFTELYTAVGPSGNNIVVPGNATITGDLTVDTSTLKVDSANNRVGIGIASPIDVFQVSSNNPSVYITDNSIAGSDQANLYFGPNTVPTYAGILVDILNDNFNIRHNSSTRLSIGSTGIFTWQNVGGVAGTAMTLNSTGLGVGGSPITRLTVNKSSQTPGGTTPNGALVITDTAGGNLCLELGVNSAGNPWVQSRNSTTGAYYDLNLQPNGGNVGVGVTPSYRLQSAVASGADGNIFAAQVIGASNGFQVLWNHATTTTRVIIANIPTSSAGLAAGTLWNDAGTIKIA